MNPDRLLALYERIADAPDAVARLRRFILDLAVRGRLVPQDPADEPAENLLRRMKVSRIECAPFELPANWAWVNVGSVSDARLGKMLDKAKNKGNPRPYLRNINVRWFDFDLSNLFEMPFEDHELHEFGLRAGDVLICEGGEPGRAAVWDTRAEGIYFQKAIHRVRFKNIVDPAFFVNALRASADDGRLAASFTGTGIKHFTGKGLAAYGFPLPPLAEQHRIVAKVDELMALCDRLEAARARRESTRDRLAAASLARLNAPDPDPATFTDHVRFALHALSALTRRPDQIKQLRQTILNLAVRGKLVPQDPNDEPADELLKRIGKGWSKATDRVSESTDLDSLPTGWEMARVDNCFVVSGGIQKTPARTPKQHAFPYLGVGNVYRHRLDLSNVKRFELAAGELEKYALRPGDILVVEGNGSQTEIGRCAVWNGELDNCVHQNHLIRCRPLLSSLTPFVSLLFNSPDGMAEMKRLAITSAGLYNLSVGKIRKITLSIPPLPEQHRIVAKVDQLMALCDRLEASLATADSTRRRLLDALLQEALAPAMTADSTDTAEALAS